jgi:hypothetical protein
VAEEWDQVKLRARVAVHTQFARSAVYRVAPDAMLTTAIKARRHTKQTLMGDLDREGYAQVLQDVNAIVVDLNEIAPVRGALVTFVGDGAKFLIENVEHSDDGRFARCPVTPYDR